MHGAGCWIGLVSGEKPQAQTCDALGPDAAGAGGDPCRLAVLVTEFGKPFTANGFVNWFRKRCDEAGLPRCSAHGLRKAGPSIAAANGATERQLMAIFGWTTRKEADRYTRAARQKVLAASGMKLLTLDQKLNEKCPGTFPALADGGTQLPAKSLKD